MPQRRGKKSIDGTRSVVPGLVVAGFVRLVLVARLVRLAHLFVVVLAGLVVVPRLVVVVVGLVLIVVLVPIAAVQMKPVRLCGRVVVVRLFLLVRLCCALSLVF